MNTSFLKTMLVLTTGSPALGAGEHLLPTNVRIVDGKIDGVKRPVSQRAH
jgi:hypothetical protein